MPEIRKLVCPDGTIGLRVPDHEAILRVLQRLPMPLVLTSANLSGAHAALTAEEVVSVLGKEVALVIDDGPCRYGRPSTVVRIEGESWRVLREGVMTTADLRLLAARVILFVCTGNTCRSPMAEVLCKQLLAERMGCRIEELPAHGFVVHSAGLSAMMGAGAAEEAVESARKYGADLSAHQSQRLSARMLAQADHVIVMTRAHRSILTDLYPGRCTAPELLSRNGEDLPDPIGESQEVYDQCAHIIRSHLDLWLSDFVKDER
jgi:protein-tyrosine phosphatase